MSIRLIAVDLDGTLLSSDSATVHERNIRALRRAAEKGAKIVLASGRSMVMMEDAAEQLGCVSYIISSLGGAVTDYADTLTAARQIATGRMVKDAEALGADAIVGMRYASASVMQGAAEVIAYGTAVKFV